MLKQWLMGRDKKSSGNRNKNNFRSNAHRQRNNQEKRKSATNFPLGDSYLVYRKNPVYIDELLCKAANPSSLHVNNWCALACPLHLNAACACKPAFIYCDACDNSTSNLSVLSNPIYQNLVKMQSSTDSGVNTIASNVFDDVTNSENVPDVINETQKEVLDTFFVGHKLSSKKVKNGIHIYMNSDFVSEIAVPNTVLVQSTDEQSPVSASQSPNGNPIDFSYVTNETDSLESLHIDERIFALHEHVDKGGKNKLEDSTEEQLDVLPVQASTYEAVKDLYEKLSNSRERQMMVQAINGSYNGSGDGDSLNQSISSGSGRKRKLKTLMGNTYETLTKHTRKSYAKLVEEDSNFYSNGFEGSQIFHINVRHSNPPTFTKLSLLSLQKDNDNGDINSAFSTDKIGHPSQLSSASHATNDDNIVTLSDENRSSQSDQFITKRDPKYGPQIDQTVTVQSHIGVFTNLRKLFEKKQYRDACKILITTLIGLTAFGIITALSLSISRP